MNSRFCTKCGGANAVANQFCSACGSPLNGERIERSLPATEAAVDTAARGETLSGFCAQVVRWLGRHFLLAIGFGVLAAIAAWFFNVIALALAGGFSDARPGGPLVGRGNLINGSLVWMVGSSVFFGVCGYWWSAGTSRLLQDISGFPQVLGQLFTRAGRGARVHLLWGFATALLASCFISPWLGAMLAVGLFTSLPSVLGRILSSFLFRIWSSVLQAVAPTKRFMSQGPVSISVGLMGTCCALAMTFFITSSTLKIAGALICGIIAILLSWTDRPVRSTVAFLIGVAGASLINLLDPVLVLADDGGWQEAGGNLKGWLGSQGAGTVMGYATGAAAGSGVGGVIGGGMGGAIADGATDETVPLDSSLEGRIWRLLNETNDPGLYRRLEQLQQDALDTGRVDLRELEDISRRQQDLADRRSDQIRREQQDFADRGMEQLTRRMQAEADDERAAREHELALQNEVDRRADYVDRHLDQLPLEQREIAHRILDRVNQDLPSEDDLVQLTRLTQAIHDIETGASERDAAEAELDAINNQELQVGAGRLAAAGQFAGNVVEGALLPGSGGAITNMIYSGAGSWDQGPGTMVYNTLVSGATSLASGRLERALDNPVADIASGTLFGGLEAELKGEDPHEAARNSALFGGLLGGARSLGGRLNIQTPDLNTSIDIPGVRPSSMDAPGSVARGSVDLPAGGAATTGQRGGNVEGGASTSPVQPTQPTRGPSTGPDTVRTGAEAGHATSPEQPGPAARGTSDPPQSATSQPSARSPSPHSSQPTTASTGGHRPEGDASSTGTSSTDPGTRNRTGEGTGSARAEEPSSPSRESGSQTDASSAEPEAGAPANESQAAAAAGGGAPPPDGDSPAGGGRGGDSGGNDSLGGGRGGDGSDGHRGDGEDASGERGDGGNRGGERAEGEESGDGGRGDGDAREDEPGGEGQPDAAHPQQPDVEPAQPQLPNDPQQLPPPNRVIQDRPQGCFEASAAAASGRDLAEMREAAQNWLDGYTDNPDAPIPQTQLVGFLDEAGLNPRRPGPLSQVEDAVRQRQAEIAELEHQHLWGDDPFEVKADINDQIQELQRNNPPMREAMRDAIAQNEAAFRQAVADGNMVVGLNRPELNSHMVSVQGGYVNADGTLMVREIDPADGAVIEVPFDEALDRYNWDTAWQIS